MRAPCNTPPFHMGKGSGMAANLRASYTVLVSLPEESAGRESSGLGVTTVTDSFEQRRGEIALAGVRQHRENHRALRRVGRHFERGRDGGAGGDAAEDTLAGTQ